MPIVLAPCFSPFASSACHFPRQFPVQSPPVVRPIAAPCLYTVTGCCSHKKKHRRLWYHKYRVLRSEAIMRYHLSVHSPSTRSRFIINPHSPECYPVTLSQKPPSSQFSRTSYTTTSLSGNSTRPSPSLYESTISQLTESRETVRGSHLHSPQRPQSHNDLFASQGFQLAILPPLRRCTALHAAFPRPDINRAFPSQFPPQSTLLVTDFPPQGASFPGGITTSSIKRRKNHGYESSTNKRQRVEPEMSTVEGCTTPITTTESQRVCLDRRLRQRARQFTRMSLPAQKNGRTSPRVRRPLGGETVS
jgi:hypothetical protein